jgi:hypothetical protein
LCKNESTLEKISFSEDEVLLDDQIEVELVVDVESSSVDEVSSVEEDVEDVDVVEEELLLPVNKFNKSNPSILVVIFLSLFYLTIPFYFLCIYKVFIYCIISERWDIVTKVYSIQSSEK